MSDLDYLNRLADQVERLHARGAHDEADRLFAGPLLESLDHELVVRGNVHEPAIFDTLLLLAQQARQPVPVEKESVDVESR